MAHELLTMARSKGSGVEENLAIVDAMQFEMLDFDGDDARFAPVKSAPHSRSRGRRIGPYDVLIAGQALSRGLISDYAATRANSRV